MAVLGYCDLDSWVVVIGLQVSYRITFHLQLPHRLSDPGLREFPVEEELWKTDLSLMRRSWAINSKLSCLCRVLTAGKVWGSLLNG